MKLEYIVAYATYNRNESKDALICGVFPGGYATAEAAYKAARNQITQEAIEYIADCGGVGRQAAEGRRPAGARLDMARFA